MPTYQQHPSSFRDPSGFIFEAAGKLYRQINSSYADDYEQLMQSGLYKKLTDQQWLIPHSESEPVISISHNRYKTILPEFISFLSYPYEWCFGQLQDAALLTLQLVKTSVAHGMILKDATPYNIQFPAGKPIHIDTLSFEKYDETKPWVAYRQFCECYLYPLLVANYSSIEVHRLYLAYPNGIPAATAAHLLPAKARFNLGNWLHVFLPASVSANRNEKQISFSKNKMLRIIEHLQQIIQSLKPFSKTNSAWDHYYDKEILSEEYLANKEKIIKERMITNDKISVLDLGCNQGLFSTLYADQGNCVVAVDDNSFSISKLYADTKKSGLHILPLCIDLTNPPGNGGFKNEERKSLVERMKFDLCLSLALIHHLCIGKNIPFESLAVFLSGICSGLIIEFIPKEDEKVRQMLKSRKDIFTSYNQKNFEQVFQQFFAIEESYEIHGSVRVLYKMRRL